MKNIFLFFSALLVLALGVGVVASLPSGFEDWNVKAWFGADNAVDEPSSAPDDSSVSTEKPSYIVTDVDVSSYSTMCFAFTEDDYNEAYDCYYRKIYCGYNGFREAVNKYLGEYTYTNVVYIGVNDFVLRIRRWDKGINPTTIPGGQSFRQNSSVCVDWATDDLWSDYAQEQGNTDLLFYMQKIASPGGGIRTYINETYYEVFMSEPGILTFYYENKE